MKPIPRLAIHLLLGLGLGFAINQTLRPAAESVPNKVVHTPSGKSAPARAPAVHRLDLATIPDEIAALAQAADRPRARLQLEQRLLAEASRNHRSSFDVLIRAIDTADGQGSTELGSLLHFFLRRIADEDPAAALDHVQDLANAQMRESVFARIAHSWSERDPRALLEYAESSEPGIVRSRGTYIAIDYLAKTDPRGALDYALAADGFVFNLTVFGNVFKNWFRMDSGAAEKWLLEDGSPNDRRRVHAGALHAYIDTDPAGAVAFIDRLPADREPEFWRRQAIARWASSDPTATLNAIREMPQEYITERLLHEVSRSVSWDSSESVFKFAENLDLSDPQANAAYISGAINPHVFPEIGEAAALATELPEGRWRREAFDDVVSRWFDRDEVAASEWLGSLPPSPSRDVAVWRFVSELAPIDPERAAGWAMSIDDPKRRSKSLKDALGSWRATDLAAAEAWEAKNVPQSETEE